MEPWQSWSIVGIVSVGAYWYYSTQYNPKNGRGRAPVAAREGQKGDSTARVDTKGRKNRGNNPGPSDHFTSDVAEVSSASIPTSSNDRLKKRKGGKKQPSQLAQTSVAEISNDQNEGIGAGGAAEEVMDNKEFARQLSGLKTGISLNRSAGNGETKKTRNEGKRNGVLPDSAKGILSNTNGFLGVQDLSTASSTTGADADDDLSPAMSPDFGATPTSRSAGGVSDMLEPPSKGPSILRLTDSAIPQQVGQPKPQRPAQDQETKKQRQNRQKNEEKKFAREQAEKERRVLLEKQLRTAREAEGRPAKNGIASSQPPSTSAWMKPAARAGTATAPISTGGNGPLLDTFEETIRLSEDGQAYEPNGKIAQGKVLEEDLPSEEEQIRMLSEMDENGWNTVKKGGKGRKNNDVKTEDLEVNSQISATNAGQHVSRDDWKAVVVNGNGSASKANPSATSTMNKFEREDAKPARNNDSNQNSKTTRENIDPKVWNRSNIHNHPDYDPEFPYALTGHPDDSDWAVV